MFLESEEFDDENYLDDFMVVVEDYIKDDPHLENECIKGNNTIGIREFIIIGDVCIFIVCIPLEHTVQIICSGY